MAKAKAKARSAKKAKKKKKKKATSTAEAKAGAKHAKKKPGANKHAKKKAGAKKHAKKKKAGATRSAGATSAAAVASTAPAAPTSSGVAVSTVNLAKILEEPALVVARIDEIAPNLEAPLDELKGRIGAAEYVDLATLLPPRQPEGYYHHTWGGRALVACMFAKEAGARAPAFHETGDLDVSGDGLRIVGDLTVDGDLKVSGNLIVLGDLSVGGKLTDEQGAQTVVTGALTARGGVLTEAFLSVGGLVKAPVVWLDFNQGFAKLLGGVDCRIFLECDHGGSRVFGRLNAEYANYDECEFDDVPTVDNSKLKTMVNADLPDDAGAFEVGDAIRAPFMSGALFK